MESDIDHKNLIQNYLDQMTENEKKSLGIAKDHLGSSFSLEKSIGFISWLKKNKNNVKTK